MLGTLEALYRLEGEGRVWDHLGRLNDQQRSLIEERFKFVSKHAAKTCMAIGPPRAGLIPAGNATDLATGPVRYSGASIKYVPQLTSSGS